MSSKIDQNLIANYRDIFNTIQLQMSLVRKVDWDRTHYKGDDKAYLENMLTANVIEKDVDAGRTLVIFGDPGCGKKTFVESCLIKLDQNKDFKKRREVVRLSGYICTDLKISIQDIGYKLSLNIPNLEEDDVNVNKGHLDERLSEITQFLKDKLKNSERTIIFILENIELFTEHKGQALLYTLFDLAQNNAPIVVIGITSNQELLDHFEKRVKSRYSHRKIYLSCPSFEEYKKLAVEILLLNNKKDEPLPELKAEIEKIIKKSEVNEILQRIYNERDKSIGTLAKFMYEVLLYSSGIDKIKVKDIELIHQKWTTSSRMKQIQMLTEKEILLLLGIFKIVSGTSRTFNAEQVWGVIDKIAKAYSLNKNDFLFSLQALEDKGMILPAENITYSNQYMRQYKSQLMYDEFKDIPKYCQLPTNFSVLL